MANISNASDAQTWLDNTKVTISDGDDTLEQNAAEQIVRAYLANVVDATTMATWNIATPTSVPGIVRQIGGQLAASFRLQKLYSEGSVSRGVMPYAQELYNRAMATINDIVVGKAMLYDVSTSATVEDRHITSNKFFSPNNSTADPVPILANPDTSTNAYKFGMGMIF